MTNASSNTRQAHADRDLAQRELKARKIERLLDLENPATAMRLLEVGTGAGGIASYFATRPHGRFEVDAVDTLDNRQTSEGYRFQIVRDVQLPFANDSFDVVISNHVIEHVGDRNAQLMHLREIRRVLREGGVGYLAVPNRWQVTEPHYGVRFLSWLPRPMRSPYLRWRGKGTFYDCEPLTLPGMDSLIEQAGLIAHHLELQALRLMVETGEISGMPARVAARLPYTWLSHFRRLIPTLICRIQRARR